MPTQVLRDGVLRDVKIAVHGGDGSLEIELAGLGASIDDACDVLVCCGDGDTLRDCVDSTFDRARDVAVDTLIPRGAGRIVLLAPRVGAFDHAYAARAALANMARTLSVEWARYGIVTTAILPSPTTADTDITTLVGFLASPAGGYYSGCVFELR